MRALLDHPWPGNIRELQNMIERGVILAPQGGRIEIEHLFTCHEALAKEVGLDRNGELDVNGTAALRLLCETVLGGPLSLDAIEARLLEAARGRAGNSRLGPLDAIEAMLLEAAVDRAQGNLSSAARMLGITRPRLAYRLKRLQEGGEAPAPAEAESAPATPEAAAAAKRVLA